MKFAFNLAVLATCLSLVTSIAAFDEKEFRTSHTNGTRPVALTRRQESECPRESAQYHATPVRQQYRRQQTARSHTVAKRANGKVNAAYFVNWGVYDRQYFPNDIPVSNLTHVNYAFGTIDPSTGNAILSDTYADQQMLFDGDSSTDTGNNLYGSFGQFLKLKKANRHLKLTLSIGGWSYSPLFAPMAANATQRANFISSAVDIVKNYGLDGLDLDWEFPSNAADVANFVAILKGLRQGMDAYAASVGQSTPFLLSIAAPCGAENYSILDMKSMDKYLDFWNLMGYDYAGSWSDKTGHQANLYGGPPSSADCVTGYLSGGASANKVLLGMPIYGRLFDKTNGPGSTFNGVGTNGGYYDYRLLPLSGGVESYNATLGASWSYDTTKREFVSYDNPQVVKQKVEYANKMGLAGAMFWELSGDANSTSRSLVVAAANALGTLDSSPNHIVYPDSIWDNVRGSNVPPPPGNAALGSTCSVDTECASNSCTSGFCVPQAGQGADMGYCNLSSQCTSNRCWANKCREKRDNGGVCTVDDTCVSNSCVSGNCVPQAGGGATDDYCNLASQCSSGICTDNTCQAKKAELGTACTASSGCISNSCVSGFCVPQAGQGVDTAYCNLASQCSSGLCTNNKCQAQPPQSELGVACTANAGCKSASCVSGFCVPQAGQGADMGYCNLSSQCTSNRCWANKCREKRDSGGACTVDDTCVSNSCVSGNCVPQAGKGAADEYCNLASQCSSGSCTGSKCQAQDSKTELGTACTANAGCKSGSCVSGTCVPQAGQGADMGYCNLSSQCTSNRCWANKCREKRDNGGVCTVDDTCVSNSCVSGNCVPQAGGGATDDYCNLASQCSSGVCTDNKCQDGPAQTGDVCDTNAACLSNICDAGRCVPKPKEGNDMDYCTQSSQCVTERCFQNRCRERKQLGGTCDSNETCLSNRCSPTMGRCIPASGTGPVGGYCTNGTQCVNSLCSANACEDKRVAGLACTDDVNCASSRCSPTQQKCIPAKGAGLEGDFCTNNSQCTSATCTNSACS